MSDYLGGDGSRTFNDLTEYLEEARMTPAGWLWVDCPIKPTTVYDMEAVYINITTALECAVPPSIIDEFGILRKVKAQLMKNLVIVSTEPSNPDYVIVAAGQLLYHIVWPSDGTVSTIATSIGARLQPYNALPTTVVFDRYGNVSAKDHERERRSIGVCVLVLTTSLSLHLFPTEKS